ncbi:MAG: DEAD/DEAH box family ATP-dependent RNA helicase [Pseudomonadota bacterium]|nr:DEAD/DEAH box helicase [Rubrivivax sp.]
MSFDILNLPEPLTRALASAGYLRPTDVQAAAIPPALAGRDLMVASRTGSGKTASFMLPALVRVLAARAAEAAARAAAGPRPTQPGPTHRGPRRPAGPARGPRVLVLAPTRELALQVAKAAHDYGRHVPRLAVATLVGGVPYGAQLRALGGPLDIAVATPGRLLDHLGSGRAVLANVELLVLDEADRMLDMGFIDDIHAIAAALPQARQTLMYSATFGGDAGRLAAALLRAPERIELAAHTEAHADIEQRLHWADDFGHKHALLEHILGERALEQALVFTSTQRDAEALAARLADIGHAVEALHGGMPQGRRNRVLQGLRNRRLRVLVATDVAARGIDVPSISHVINFGLPMKEEDYVHRIGRTGRAGRTGLAVTLAERRDFGMIQRIQRFTTQRIPAATIPGLEPRRPEPRPQPSRGAGAPAPGTQGKPQGKARSGGFGKGMGAGAAYAKPAGRAFGPAGRRFAPPR